VRTFWLSFGDPDRPKGEQFLDAARAKRLVMARFPHAHSGSEWIAAAGQVAWATGCNPGGQILTIDVTGEHETDKLPRNRLLSKADLSDLGMGVEGT
jgi:hypothetical protein